MNPRWSRIALGAALALTATNFLSCGTDRKLAQIIIQPPAATFLDPSPGPANVIVYTALGEFIHPPLTKDITGRVTWKTDTPGLLVINGGQVSPFGGGACGIGDISAELLDHGNLVISYATATVNDATNPICPGGSVSHGVVTVAITGSGTVASSPAGITCPGACGSQFNVNDIIVLSAAPATGHTFGSWSGCPSVNGTNCTITVPKGSVNVTATFI